jgi:hypothetical protein
MSGSSSSTSASNPPRGWEAPSPEELQALLPQYEIQGLLGRGGMGAVYKARQKSLRRWVAIKVLPGDATGEEEDQRAERFKNEACTLAQLSHPGIVNVFDFGTTQDGPMFFVMEFVDGTDVARMIQESGRLPPAEAQRIAAGVCEALDYAHGNGVIHRDIKPANILITPQRQVKVADFGLAKMQQAEWAASLTRSHSALGTPDYVAPEALLPGAVVDQRADVYGVGVMLYQMLTGEVPRGMFKLPSQKVPDVDIRFDAIICKAMEQDPEERYQTVREMKQALEEVGPGALPKTSAPDSPALPPPAAPVRKRFPTRAAVMTAACVALMVLMTAILVRREHGPQDSTGAIAPQTVNHAQTGKAAESGACTDWSTQRPWDSTWELRDGMQTALKDEAMRGLDFMRDGAVRVRALPPVNPNPAPGEWHLIQLTIREGPVQGSPDVTGMYQFQTFLPSKTCTLLYQEKHKNEPGKRPAENLWQSAPLPAHLAGRPDLEWEIRAVGNEISAFANGELIASAHDSRVPAGGRLLQARKGIRVARLETIEGPPPNQIPLPANLDPWQDVTEMVREKARKTPGLEVQDGTIRRVSTDQPMRLLLTPPGQNDYAVRVRYSHQIQVDLRSANEKGFLFVLSQTHQTLCNRYQPNAAAADILSKVPHPPDFDPGQEHELVVVMQGPHIRAWLDGRRAAEARDGSFKEGAAALMFVARSVVHSVAIADPAKLGAISEGDTIAQHGGVPPGRRVDLLALVDLSQDAFRGVWARAPQGIAMLHTPGPSVLRLPYQPPEEYDFEIEFTPDGDGLNVNQFLCADGHSFAWKMNSHNIVPPLYGFELLDGKFAKELREAAASLETALVKGTRYRSKVEVRRGGLRALLDGKEVVRWSGDFARFSMETHSHLGDDRHIGVGSWKRGATFHKIRVTEVSGPGIVDARPLPEIAWQDWLGPRLKQGFFERNGWIREAEGVTTDQRYRGESVLPAGTRDGAVRVTYVAKGSEGGSVTFRHTGEGDDREFYVAYDTGQTLFISRARGAEQPRLVSQTIPADIQKTAERTLEVRFVGNRLTATLNGAFTVTAADDALREGMCAVVASKGVVLTKVETLILPARAENWQLISTKADDFGKNLKAVDPNCVEFREGVLFLINKTVVTKDDARQGAVRATVRNSEGRTGSVTIRASEDVKWGEETFAAGAYLSEGGASVVLQVRHPKQKGSEPDKYSFALSEPVKQGELFSLELRVEKRQLLVFVNSRQVGVVEDPAPGMKRRFGVIPPVNGFGEFREISWLRLPDSAETPATVQ